MKLGCTKRSARTVTVVGSEWRECCCHRTCHTWPSTRLSRGATAISSAGRGNGCQLGRGHGSAGRGKGCQLSRARRRRSWSLPRATWSSMARCPSVGDDGEGGRTARSSKGRKWVIRGAGASSFPRPRRSRLRVVLTGCRRPCSSFPSPRSSQPSRSIIWYPRFATVSMKGAGGAGCWQHTRCEIDASWTGGGWVCMLLHTAQCHGGTLAGCFGARSMRAGAGGLRRSAATFAWPARCARLSAVCPRRSKISISASGQCRRMCRTASTCPADAATINGVQPYISVQLMSAPSASPSRRALTSPYWAAKSILLASASRCAGVVSLNRTRRFFREAAFAFAEACGGSAGAGLGASRPSYIEVSRGPVGSTGLGGAAVVDLVTLSRCPAGMKRVRRSASGSSVYRAMLGARTGRGMAALR
eukprot:m.13403 g.13403  ORF g.13403 m.13403 type:complete len:417 (+) comp2823_c0_seq1:176-1426(+)